MRNSITFGALALVVALTAGADVNRDRGKTAGQSVLGKWGSPSALQQNAMTPLASGEQMQTIDGTQAFGAKISCPGAKTFLKLTIIPGSAGDIANLGVSLDTNLDGTPDQNTVLPGPFGALCDNGMVQCPAGTMTGCSYKRWEATPSGITLNPNNGGGGPNTIRDMGACYCFNNSCGNGLLIRNAEKVLNDTGAGIALAMQASTPRFAMSGSSMVDSLSAEFFGQTSGCGADQRPEQYYKNTGALQAQGVANQSDPNSTYNKILASPNAAGHNTTTQACQINRNITMSGYWNTAVLGATFTGDGTAQSCGDGCVRITTGRDGFHYLNARCGIYTTSASITVNRPELISSATLVMVSYDDFLRVRMNGTIVWNADPSWTWEGTRCGENDNRGTKYPGTDLTSWFTGTPAGGTLQFRQDTTWEDKGQGWAVIEVRYNQDCDIASETIDNGCAAQESNANCSLRDERVDSTQTIQGYARTGLTPLPSTKDYSFGACNKRYTRDYFQKQRSYTCPATASPYSGEAAQKRYESIHQSFDPTTGNFTDTTYQNGTYTSSPQQLKNLPPPDSVQACPMVCRTRKDRPGVAVGEPGPVNTLNPGGVAYDFTYRECSESNVCPAEAGETIVSACACRNNFGEAAAAMQTIRQVAEDSLCQAQ